VKIVTTLVEEENKVYDILESVPEDSVVLLPEDAKIGNYWDIEKKGSEIADISRRRNLFVIVKVIYEKGGRYNSMIGYEKGNPLWRVRKHFLWKDEADWFDSPSEPEPIVNIRGKKSGIAICYEISKVGGFGKLLTIGKILSENKAELLFMPSHWQFNWHIPMFVSEMCIKTIPSLKGGGFSSSNVKDPKSYAMVFRRGNNGNIEFKRTQERNSFVSMELIA
jgi:hypothetical protein